MQFQGRQRGSCPELGLCDDINGGRSPAVGALRAGYQMQSMGHMARLEGKPRRPPPLPGAGFIR